MMKKRSTTSIPKSRSFNLHYRQPQPQPQTSNNTSTTSSSSGYNSSSSSSSSATQRRTMRRNHSLNSNKNTKNNSKMVIQSYSELANLAAHISDDSDSDYETNNSNNHHCSRQEASSSSDHVCDDDDDDYPTTTNTTTSTSSYDFLSRAGLSSMLMAATTTNNLSKKKGATTSRFKPSYLLQRRKEGLAQHTLPSYFDMTMARVADAPSRKQSVVALLFLVAACYALMSLAGIPTTMAAVGVVPPQSQLPPPPSPTTIHNYYYYVNLKEPQPFRLVAKLLQAHAYVHQKQQHSTATTTTTTSFHQLGGVCGYPTYQQEAQQQAHQLLEKLGLASTLLFDVCPPIEAVLHQDPHYILLDEDDFFRAGSKNNWWTPAWRRHIESQRSYYPQEALLQEGDTDHNNNNASRIRQEEGDRLWRQLMESSSSLASFTVPGPDDRRRLRGVV